MQLEVNLSTSIKQKNTINCLEAIKQFAGFFELLAKIDQRLMAEDQEYRSKYYQVQTHED